MLSPMRSVMQCSSGRKPSVGHRYNIYENPAEGRAVDAYFHLIQWVNYLRRQYGPCQPLPTDFLFPSFRTGNGSIECAKEMSPDLVSKLLEEFVNGAGLCGGNLANSQYRFTAHCLRRGGAQYRFMFAPGGQRWSLSMVRWWGGWAEGEQVRS